MLRGSDGVMRQSPSASCAPEATEVGRYEQDSAMRGYFAAEIAAQNRPINDNRRTYRNVRSPQPRHCYNSTSWKYVSVSVPRIGILDGIHNDNAQVAA